MEDKKQLILSELFKVVKKRRAEGKTFSIRALQNVITQLKKYNQQVTSLDDFKYFHGIGKGINDKLKEIFENGFIAEVNNRTQEDLNIETITDLMSVHGIGQKAASDFVSKGIKTINDLRNNKELLNNVQKLGLEYHDDITKRIPRAEIDKYNILIKKIMSFDKDILFMITGSYRRGFQSSGDIDIVISHKSKPCTEVFKEILEKLEKEGIVKGTLASGPKKFLGITKLKRHKTNRRLDMLCTEIEVYPFALLHFTGSKEFNVELRNIALDKGYSLSEFGLKKVEDGKFVDGLTSEEEILKFLGFDFIEPRNRKPSSLKK